MQDAVYNGVAGPATTFRRRSARLLPFNDWPFLLYFAAD
jgi:hypothetical protein